ncbi:hypothetical protein GA0070563_10160 [Micromonospora carbonacea]|uniref:Uncharacterized protein n=2 Tax=Micromonospora carbonacea TaxID=47853 RepID=A0A1C4TX53_9ACTN|nr:hypothetical protein GA0070563_10160 [Micromonospora carbonacea]
MGDWAGAAVALIGAAFVWTQVVVQRGQHRLQEAETHRQQATAWAALSSDWEVAQLVAAGPTAARWFGASPEKSREYLAAIEEFRAARVRFLDLLELDSVTDSDWDEYEEGVAQATSGLSLYHRSVRRIVTHLAQVSGLVMRSRLSTQVAYDAFGIELLRVRHHLPNLMREGYAIRSSCPGPINTELALWREIPAEEVAKRIGWGNFLEVGRVTAERIAVFIDLLTAYAIELGEIGLDLRDHEALPPGSELASGDRLAVAWSAGRRVSLIRAIRVVSALDRAGRKARRSNAYYYPEWLKGTAIRLGASTTWALPSNGFIRAPWDRIVRPVNIIRAAWRSRRVADVRHLDSPYEYRAAQLDE